MTKKRLDVLLAERGLAASREKARAVILAGEVRLGDRVLDRPGLLLPEDAEIRVLAKMPYVGRGGIKLAHALDLFRIDVQGKTALDVGASTGGFTDCLLQRGACRVYALDVGRGQIDYRLRTDPRVVVIEEVNARYPFDLPEVVDIATVDVSFISLTRVLPSVLAQVKPSGTVLALVKPQFEAERRHVQRGGLVKDPRVHAQVLGRIVAWVVARGVRLRGLTASPITGGDGNREFFVQLEVSPDGA
ncbi:MAG: TlyA family RNA methyltransferase [Chloroflexi bacterium]|nr:TlyA family RNA methyltransferase [Chloroflexota bacterium]